MKRLIDLQTAYATQITSEKDGKGEWIVYNVDKEEIYRLPKEYTEKQVMEAIHLGRKFELIAFNKGVNFQKSKNPKTIITLQKMVKNLTAEKEMMKQYNDKIATELDRLTLKYN